MCFYYKTIRGKYQGFFSLFLNFFSNLLHFRTHGCIIFRHIPDNSQITPLETAVPNIL